MCGDHTRRRAIRAVGAAATLTVSGCLGDNPLDSEPDENTSGQAGPEILRVAVTGFQFGWEYEYGGGPHSDEYEVDLDGTDDDSALVLPSDEPVHLTFSSRDVPHVYGIPSLRLKADVLPDERTQIRFLPEETGVYEAACYELCGQGHANMLGDVVVTEPATFADWYLSQDGTSESDLAFMSDTRV